ncbi:DNA/RNA non-specific endonuclease [Weissella uvarum]|nr:DNA/RNA non-specific endonuclease [Weissella uvarum]
MGQKLTITGIIVVLALFIGQQTGLINEHQVNELKQVTGVTKQYQTNRSSSQRVGSLSTNQTSDLPRHPTQSQAATVLTPAIKQQLNARQISFNGTGAFVINQNKTDLNANVRVAPYVQLAQTDQYGRPGVANAFLNNSSREYRKRETTGNATKINPVGWQQMRLNDNRVLYNRGHSIAYALAGGVKGFDASEANRQNITTQTTWANQASNGDTTNTGQNYYESIVRKGLDQHKTIRYRVTPLYEGKNLVPSGSHIEAKSQDGSIQFNVFIPNVEPGVTINYANGSAKAQ